MIFNSNKKGLSDVVATVLILLVTISAAIIVGTVIYNMVKDSLKNEYNTCKEIQEEISLVRSGSCYNKNETASNTTIRIMFGNANITRMNIYLDTGSESKLYELKIGNSYPDVKNSNRGWNTTLEFPKAGGGEKIYIFNNTVAENAKIAGVINNYPCDISDEIIVEKCS